MNDFQKKYLLKRQDFGILYPYLTEEKVTEINWNGRQLWVNDLDKGKYMAADILSDEFVERLASLIANMTDQAFSRRHPIMEAETEDMHICVMHRSVVHSGTTITLRKTPAVRRLIQSELVESGYCSEAILDFLRCCIEAHFSVAICGLPGAGKTELLKYLTKFIPATERVMTIEDVLEIHYQKLNPNKDCVEMKVAENFTYMEAMKTCLRQLPKWLILSEARSCEVKYLLESLSSGVAGLTTIQADDVRNIPERMKSMVDVRENLQRIENDIYRYLDIGILVKHVRKADGNMHRRIEQIAVFDRYGREWKKAVNRIIMVTENGEFVNRQLPEDLMRRFQEMGIDGPMGGVL